jgi:serralysin
MMPSPVTNSPTFTFTGSTGNSLIDAMLIPQEILAVSVANRATVVGNTMVEWGNGPVGTGIDLSYSFITTSSVFASNYPAHRNGIVNVSEAWRNEFRSAFAEWAAVANVRFHEIEESSTDAGQIRIGVTTTGVSQTGGEAGPPGAASLQGDVWIGASFPLQLRREAAVHELGHAIFGLNDVTTNLGLHGASLPAALNNRIYTIMSYSTWLGVVPGADYEATNGGVSFRPTTLMVLDILAAQYAYGANMNYHAGDDTYQFLPGQSYFETIWDAGGSNTFDVSQSSHDCVLDLQPGQYSDVGTSINTYLGSTAVGSITRTVGIAFGVTIQNAVGGSGNDFVMGNSANNTIVAGSGNDTVVGGLGGDFLALGLGNDVGFGNQDNDVILGN